MWVALRVSENPRGISTQYAKETIDFKYLNCENDLNFPFHSMVRDKKNLRERIKVKLGKIYCCDFKNFEHCCFDRKSAAAVACVLFFWVKFPCVIVWVFVCCYHVTSMDRNLYSDKIVYTLCFRWKFSSSFGQRWMSQKKREPKVSKRE